MEAPARHKKKPTKIEDMTKEQIRQAILKKRECNAKAQTIVESLLEKDITEDYFMQCLPDINQSHFKDIIEERAIIHICGYPLCSKTISERDIPKQKYRISVKTNKVYDITARKSFCSNHCFRSAMYVKKQMLISPLWFREYEDIPKFQLLPLDSVGSLGQEIDVALVEKISIQPSQNKFTSINDFADASLQEMTGSEINSNKNNELTCKTTSNVTIESNISDTEKENADINKNTKDQKHKHNDTIIDQDNHKIEESHNNANTEIPVTKKEEQKKSIRISHPTNIIGEIIEKPEHKIDPIITNPPVTQETCKKSIQKKQPSVAVITIEVEKCLAEWFTLDTLLFLFGNEKVKEMVIDKGECIKDYLNNYAKSMSYSCNIYDQYQTLCRKLNMLELEDRHYDTQTLQHERKPLPDYSIIQEESKKMQLKVKAFFAGETEIPEIDTREEKQNEAVKPNNVTQLPLVDKNAQNALRRRIVCQHLDKVLRDLLRSLGLLTMSVSSDVRLFVNTFKLQADNIMFKPIQWMLIGMVILKLLSLRDRRLEDMLASQTAYEHMQLLLLSYNQDGGYLERLISWLTDIDRLLDTNDVQLTME